MEARHFLLGFVRSADMFGVTSSYYGTSLFAPAPTRQEIQEAVLNALNSYGLQTAVYCIVAVQASIANTHLPSIPTAVLRETDSNKEKAIAYGR